MHAIRIAGSVQRPIPKHFIHKISLLFCSFPIIGSQVHSTVPIKFALEQMEMQTKFKSWTDCKNLKNFVHIFNFLRGWKKKEMKGMLLGSNESSFFLKSANYFSCHFSECCAKHHHFRRRQKFTKTNSELVIPDRERFYVALFLWKCYLDIVLYLIRSYNLSTE